tara:strand:+ start:17339 stop:18049 length:711 start_codon:yes stop_codon:yes gene_type:complete
LTKNQIAVITGASEGIGRAISIKLASEGYYTILAGRNEENLRKTAKLISQVNGQSLVYKADITSEQDVMNLFRKVVKLGELVILVNNAGVGTFKAVEEISLKEWQDMLDVNLTGSFLSTREAIKLMKKNKKGHIIFINSMSGKRALSWGSGYSATKYGLKGFADTVRIELRKSNVKVTSIFPGSVNSSWWDKLDFNFSRDQMLNEKNVVDAVFSTVSQEGHSVIEEIDLRQVGGDF